MFNKRTMFTGALILMQSAALLWSQQGSTSRNHPNRSTHWITTQESRNAKATGRAQLFNTLKKTGKTSNSGGNFTLKASSPQPLTCVAIDPTTNIIYAQGDEDTTFYKYYPDSNKWVSLAGCPINSENNGGAVYLNGKIYTNYTSGGCLGCGGGGGGKSYRDGGLRRAEGTEEGGGGGNLGVYDIATNTWTVETSQVATGNIEAYNGYIYFMGDYDFQRLNPITMDWDTLTHPSVLSGNFDGNDTWGTLKFYNGYLYNINGDGSSDFAKYDLSDSQWTLLPSLPDGAVLGGAIDPINKTLYAYGNYGGDNIYSFNFVQEQWDTTAEPFFGGIGGGARAEKSEEGGGEYALDDGGMAYVSTGPTPGIYYVEGEGGSGFAVYQPAGPHAQINFFQDKYLTQYLDIVAISKVPLSTTPTISVTMPNNSTQNLAIDTVDLAHNVFYSHFELTASGQYTFGVVATDTGGNSGDTNRTLTAVLSKANMASGITSVDGKASLNMAPQTLSKDAYLTLSDETSVAAPNESAHAVSDLYNFGPYGIALQKPVTVTFDYSKLTGIDAAHLVIYQKTSGGFTPLVTTVNPGTQSVSAISGQLGQFQLFSSLAKTGAASAVPKQFSLSQNYPNPFNPSTTIKFDLPAKTNVSLTIYNMLGQEVRSLAHRAFEAGSYSIVWDGKNNFGNFTSSGIYIYQIKTDQFVKAKKMVLIK